MAVDVGDQAPEICLPDMDGNEFCLADARGSFVVLYFYPKDNSSSCTIEAKDFTAEAAAFAGEGARVIGISPDSTESHRRFTEKQALDLTLLSDPDRLSMEAFGVWVKKRMYGKEYMGVERSTFIIDPEGRIAAAWHAVKVKGHAAAVLDRLRELKGASALQP
ncbi:peroxiredoxin [Methanofollis tationis]|uniref:thioredoxin-dependent peroxiredoxin n=1 Tax=Methanofollis tationis TaxID=81417 RepID=A0A7K4HLC6_9EURY|nr:peroxiredoxin [Methanofollis tationis]NVO65847.1 peroxiredoxin [Methanofollis tationis]